MATAQLAGKTLAAAPALAAVTTVAAAAPAAAALEEVAPEVDRAGHLEVIQLTMPDIKTATAA